MTRAGFIGLMTVTTLILALGGPAGAQSKKARVAAHKNKAFQLFEAGDYAGGIAEMEDAYALIPHPGFLLNIAVAYDRWPGHCQDSLDTFDWFFTECDGCKLQSRARKTLADVERTCRVEIAIDSTPAGARVAVDGTFRGETPFTTRLLPGDYTLVLDLSGHERAMKTISVARGQPQALTLELPLKAAPPPPPPPPPLRVDTTPPSPGPSPFTWVGFGVGAAGLATGAVFTALALKAIDHEKAARQTPLPKADIVALQEDARRDAIVAHVAYGVGIAGVATGVVLLFVTRGPANDSAPVALVPAVGPGGAGVAGRF